jgi:hypothetical protein
MTYLNSNAFPLACYWCLWLGYFLLLFRVSAISTTHIARIAGSKTHRAGGAAAILMDRYGTGELTRAQLPEMKSVISAA